MYLLASGRRDERPFYQAYRSTIAIVGCGGTGSLLAEGLCRLLIDRPDLKLLLVDHDKVEPHNLRRQAFYQGDVGQFKAFALAHRLTRQFDRPVGFAVGMIEVSPYSNKVLEQAMIVVGCVDNPLARKALAQQVTTSQWWVDCGNSDTWGQVLVGNARSPGEMQQAFDPALERCWRLPLPTIQRPELLLPVPEPPQVVQGEALDCAQEVMAGGQSATINQAMAALALEVVRRLLLGTCPWMGLYLGLERGELRPVYATPQEAARLMGLKANQVMDKRRKV